MTRKLVRGTLLALIALVAVAALVNSISIEQPIDQTKAAVSAGICKSAGITEIIQFDNRTLKFCVNYQKQTGWDLLNQIGATPQGTQQYPTGFVCRLYEYPSEQDCQDTPSASEGTWNYFYATAATSSKWIYSQAGASARKPKCGDVEAWVFEEPLSNDSANEPTEIPSPIDCQ